MEPFDLEKALAGEPVKLNNGNKAYIIGKVKEEYEPKYCLLGYRINKNTSIKPETWDVTGYAGIPYQELSIAGMWEEPKPKPKRFINGIEVPEPVTEETWENGEVYYYVMLSDSQNVRSDLFVKSSWIDRHLVMKRIVFKTEEGAEAMARALLNYKVEVKEE